MNIGVDATCRRTAAPRKVMTTGTIAGNIIAPIIATYPTMNVTKVIGIRARDMFIPCPPTIWFAIRADHHHPIAAKPRNRPDTRVSEQSIN